jgi:hypothetical protein
MSISLSPELLTLNPLGETVGSVGDRSAGDRKNEIEGVLDAGDTAARSSESSRSRRSFIPFSLDNILECGRK